MPAKKPSNATKEWPDYPPALEPQGKERFAELCLRNSRGGCIFASFQPTRPMTATANTTCTYLCKEDAPAGILRGHLVCPRGKFLGQIRKTGDDEFTVYGWDGIIGVHKGAAFRKAGIHWITASKPLNEYTLR